MSSSKSSFTPLGKVLSRAASASNHNGTAPSSLNFTSSSKMRTPKIARNVNSHGDKYFVAGRSVVDGEDVAE